MNEVATRTLAVETLELDEADTLAETVVIDECDALSTDAMAIIRAAEVRTQLGIPSDYDVRSLNEAGTVCTVTIPDRSPTPGTKSIGGDKMLTLQWTAGDTFATLDGKSMPLSALLAALNGHDKALNWSETQGLNF